MGKVVQSMDAVMKTMNVEQIQKIMDKFEQQFENLDISSQFMEESISQSTAQTIPSDQVDTLMNQVADEHGLEFESELDGMGIGKQKVKEEVKESAEDDLEARLKKLQGS